MCKVFSLHVFRIQSFLWIADRNSPQGSFQIQCTAASLAGPGIAGHTLPIIVNGSSFNCNSGISRDHMDVTGGHIDPNLFRHISFNFGTAGRGIHLKGIRCTGKIQFSRRIIHRRLLVQQYRAAAPFPTNQATEGPALYLVPAGVSGGRELFSSPSAPGTAFP